MVNWEEQDVGMQTIFFYIDDAITPDKIGPKLVNPSKPTQENGMSNRNSNLF